MSVLLGLVWLALGGVLIVYRAPAARRAVDWYVRFAGNIPSDPDAEEFKSPETAVRRACVLFGIVFAVIGVSYLAGA